MIKVSVDLWLLASMKRLCPSLKMIHLDKHSAYVEVDEAEYDSSAGKVTPEPPF